MKRLALCAVLFLVAGCETPSSPTTVNGVPIVEGSYEGRLRMTASDAPGGSRSW